MKPHDVFISHARLVYVHENLPLQNMRIRDLFVLQ